MDTKKAMDVIKQFIDQATGEGLFKSVDQVLVAAAAFNAIKQALESKSRDMPRTGELQ
jgi:hypothetical protein